MDRRHFLKRAGALAAVQAATQALGCGEAKTEAGQTRGASYRVGELVESGVYFLDNKGERVTLGDQVSEYTKLVYLTVFGGAYAVKPPDKHGGLWCADSVDDMSVQRTLYVNYASQGVSFVAVAVPPVYSDRYGYTRDVFLTESGDAARYRGATSTFIQRTEALKADGSIPFDPVFYDPRFRLLDNPNEHEHVPAYGDVEPWQGRFKWHEDEQTYGTPTTWLLSPKLEVLREPFYGNVYEAIPVSINYTVRDVMAALDELLARA